MRKYGWIPDVPDHRDQVFSFSTTFIPPPKIDLRDKQSKVFDQGQIGCCTAVAVSGALEYIQLNKTKFWDEYEGVSKLFTYYNSRVLQRTVNEDSGVSIRNAIKTVSKWGFCKEDTWGFDSKNLFAKPTDDAYAEAYPERMRSYFRVSHSLFDMKSCLMRNMPVVIGVSLYESFEDEVVRKTGKVPTPKNTESLLGGHAMLCVGYDDSIKSFIVKNSYGLDWGDKGYCYIPYNYLTNSGLADDFWAIKV